MPVFNSTTCDMSATYSGFNLGGIFLVLLVSCFLFLLTSARFFNKLKTVFGSLANIILRTLYGGCSWLIFKTLYDFGASASKYLTLDDVLHLGKWGLFFLLIGYVAEKIVKKILENAGIELEPFRLFEEENA